MRNKGKSRLGMLVLATTAMIASPCYGTQLKKPKNHRTDLGPGEVTPGELEVIRVEGESEPSNQ